jgi:hypothetical protein
MADIANKLFENLQTLPGLIGQLWLSVAEAQQHLDESYMENLIAFVNMVLPLVNKNASEGGDQAKQALELFKSVAPSRYQFTETTVEVRADLQMASAEEVGVSGKVKLGAVAINAAYTKRTAYDYQASALIRTVLHAIPVSDVSLDKLLTAGSKPGAVAPASAERLKALTSLFEGLPKLQAPGE